MLENLLDEIRLYKKNESAYYDMVALAYYLHNKEVLDLPGSVLMVKVIKDLEDVEVTIPYKYDDINSYYMDYLSEEVKRIRAKYSSIKECKDVLDKFYMSNNDKFIDYKTSLAFNLPVDLCRWANEILASNIPYKTRLEMFADIVKNNAFFLDTILKNNRSYFLDVSEDIVNSRKQELFNSFINGNCKSYNVKKLFLDIIDKDETYVIFQLHYSSVFDFNALRFRITSQEANFNNMIVSSVGMLCNEQNALYSFKKLYESDGYYSHVESKVAYADNLVILHTISYADVCEFIKLSHYEPDYAQIDVLAKRVFDSIDSTTDVEEIKYYEKLRKDIVSAIIHRAKNKEEYKNLLKCANYFLEETDIDIKRKKIAEEKEQLQVKRKELSTILYKMNDEALESVPARRLVKDIEFKQEA